MIISGAEMAVIAIMKARVVPIGKPFSISACTMGIVPAALDRVERREARPWARETDYPARHSALQNRFARSREWQPRRRFPPAPKGKLVEDVLG